MPDIIERNATCARQLLEAGAEIKRLQELLRGEGANRYWEGRWRDELADNTQLRQAIETALDSLVPVCAKIPCGVIATLATAVNRKTGGADA